MARTGQEGSTCEYVDLVCQLWDSWEPDAVVMDRDTGVYADGSKVHTIDFQGRDFKNRGPLNTVRAPLGPAVLLLIVFLLSLYLP
jgi:alkanesulfonate monooxygenase SsuD/methylene tetrahydromethanopterin reductase-like flavin-dependent oxidoreductase (luciferase family)